MTAAPELTPELRAKLEQAYKAKKSITAFMAWHSSITGNVVWTYYNSKAALYKDREALTETGSRIEDFLVVDTFKEFEPEGT